jgi:hypothetical protein
MTVFSMVTICSSLIFLKRNNINILGVNVILSLWVDSNAGYNVLRVSVIDHAGIATQV